MNHLSQLILSCETTTEINIGMMMAEANLLKCCQKSFGEEKEQSTWYSNCKIIKIIYYTRKNLKNNVYIFSAVLQNSHWEYVVLVIKWCCRVSITNWIYSRIILHVIDMCRLNVCFGVIHNILRNSHLLPNYIIFFSVQTCFLAATLRKSISVTVSFHLDVVLMSQISALHRITLSTSEV